MAHDDNADDPKVKQLLDPATEADLARWFSLPSFQQVAEQPKPRQVVDEEMQAVLERQARALAAIDPALLEALRIRLEEKPALVHRFEAKIDVHVDDQFGTLDERMIDRTIAEPREVEISDDLRDDLNECTPQALLRDLHRAERDFDKTFEVVDVIEGQRVDIVAEVATAMKTSWKLPEPGRSPLSESRELLDRGRADLLRQRWTNLLPHLANRRVEE